MKKQATITAMFCDECGKRQGWLERCMGCGKEVCYDCAKSEGWVDYKSQLGFQQTGDGLFCPTCDKNPPKPVATIHALYRQLADLEVQMEREYKASRAAAESIHKRIAREWASSGFKTHVYADSDD